MNNEQEAKTQVQNRIQETPLRLPFPVPEHSLENPKEYERLRAECPVARVTMPYGGDAYLLTHHADIVKAATDAQRCGMILPSDGDVPRSEAGRVVGATEDSLFTVTPERHNKIRRLVTQAFTVKRANEMRPRVIEVTNALIDEIERKGPPADLFEDYAIKTPMAVICELLGVPPEDEKLFRKWARDLFSNKISDEEQKERTQKMGHYLYPLIEKEHANPSNTILGMLVRSHELGDDVLTEPEMFMFALGLIAAGFETVSTTFKQSAYVLLQKPELLAQLKARIDDPEALALAVEEIFRVIPLGPFGRPRIIREEIDFSGMRVQPGEVVILSLGSGNYDESVFDHPKEIDFNRTENPILTFGRGIHACLGQQLARMEFQVLWATLLKRLPDVRLAVPAEEIPWQYEDTLAPGPASVPVIW